MKRLMILTAAVCMIAAMTGCAGKSNTSGTIETLPADTAVAPASDAEGETTAERETAASTAAATKKKTSATIPAEFSANEDLDDDLVGTWKYSYAEGMDAYYVIDEDHSLISLIDITQVMHVEDGKLVIGTGDDAEELQFLRKKEHYIASSQNTVFLDIVPREDADTDKMTGDYDLYYSVFFPQDTAEKDSDDSASIQSHLIVRFVEDQASLVEMGLCYSSDEQLVFMTDKKKLLVDYKFKKDDKDILILDDEEDGEITLKRVLSLEEQAAKAVKEKNKETEKDTEKETETAKKKD
ncbi:MAG: hypothetical protein K6F80_01750 [Oscillospiraceae bacterium]|nr:hypothetical protein [Oscillospiraceae bacterium]